MTQVILILHQPNVFVHIQWKTYKQINVDVLLLSLKDVFGKNVKYKSDHIFFASIYIPVTMTANLQVIMFTFENNLDRDFVFPFKLQRQAMF